MHQVIERERPGTFCMSTRQVPGMTMPQCHVDGEAYYLTACEGRVYPLTWMDTPLKMSDTGVGCWSCWASNCLGVGAKWKTSPHVM